MIAHLKWFINIFVLALLSLTAFFVLPLAWWYGSLGLRLNLFWIWLDDSRLGSIDFATWMNGRRETFWLFYRWHIRNNMYNLRNWWKPKNGRINCVANKEVFTKVLIDDLWRDGEKVDIYGNCLEMASIKWVDEFGNESWQQNQGIKPSIKFSTWGTQSYYYTVDNSLYFRYSTARIINLFFLPCYFQLKIGANHERYLLTVKLKLKT